MSSFKPNRVAVISLWAEDAPTAVHFYRDVVGLRLLPHHGRQPAFDLDGLYLTIVKGSPAPVQNAEPAHFPLLAFAVKDLDRAVKQLQAHNVDLPWGIKTGEESRWVIFHDPAGNLIEFVQFNKAVHT